MARLESQAVGGYFPTPVHIVDRVARLFERVPGNRAPCIVDPCAGEGVALHRLARAVAAQFTAYGCELEEQRATALCMQLGRRGVHGDALRLTVSPGKGASLLYLNPPYDHDAKHGRLEQKFLDRFADVLALGGWLVFVVPHYALRASAATIAANFEQVRCWRFPDPDFAAFKQVVLVGRRMPALLPQFVPNNLQQKLAAWADGKLRVLPEQGDGESRVLVTHDPYENPLGAWEASRFDIAGAMRAARPWQRSERIGRLVPVPGVEPTESAHDILLRRYPLATPPRPAHLAAGIAAGVFNGARVEPDDPRSELPPILVKGVFDKEFVTVEARELEHGTRETQVQQPKLVVTVLDLREGTFHEVQPGVERTGSMLLGRMALPDLLAHYGEGLGRIMGEQCPAAYDPRRPADVDAVKVPPSPRKPFTAQAHAVRALVGLLGGQGARMRQRRGKAAYLLGEIGSGKSTVAALTAAAIGSQRPLILCPPHLLDSWREQIAAVCPDWDVRVLSTPEDVDAWAAAGDRSPVQCALLTREAAKLAHAWVSVQGRCPACGADLAPDDTRARKRARCEATVTLPDYLGREVWRLGELLLPYARGFERFVPPEHGPTLRARVHRRRSRQSPPYTLPSAALDETRAVLTSARQASRDYKRVQALDHAFYAAILAGDYDPVRLRDVALADIASENWSAYNSGPSVFCALLLRPGSPERAAVSEAGAAKLKSRSIADVAYDPLSESALSVEGKTTAVGAVNWPDDGPPVVGGRRAGSLEAGLFLLQTLASLATWGKGEPCGEPLYAAVPEPRRVSLAKYITRRHRDAFDFLIIDEAHEYNAEDSAQSISGNRLAGVGHPTLRMTGSVMNGYADSLFVGMWASSPKFREEFGRDERNAFVDVYGYRKRVVETRAEQSVVRGAVTDRIDRSERVAGQAPGVLPLFLLRHLLPISVTLHKADLALDLPPCEQERHLVRPTPAQREAYDSLLDALKQQIKDDMFTPLAGKLFGALSELPSYLDRASADACNAPGGYEVRYPESVGGALVAGAPALPAKQLLPKESWMIARVEAELREGRNVMVLAHHTSLTPRLARILREKWGPLVAVLDAGKVPTAKRQAWISREVVARDVRVLVTNPVAVQTGLNNLVHFATEVWMENPACNPIVYRQAVGRVDRVGQRLPTRILFPVYEGTLQETLHELLLRKVAVSVSTDGLDPESALAAAGAGADDAYLTSLSIGRRIWQMIESGYTPRVRGFRRRLA